MESKSTPKKHIKNKVVLDIALVFGSSFIVYLLSRSFNVLETLITFVHKYEQMQLDEWIIVAIYMVVALAVFSLRRWNDARMAKKELIVKNRDLKKALEEISQLKGILPICSYCKKIRDDSGKWHQIETYVHMHSEADFSHGICPECMKKHFEDLDENDS